MAAIARTLAVIGGVVMLATIAFAIFDPNPNHGTGVAGGVTIVFAFGLTGSAVACLELDRARRMHPSVGANAAAMLMFVIMLFAAVMTCWVAVVLVEEIRIAARYAGALTPLCSWRPRPSAPRARPCSRPGP